MSIKTMNDEQKIAWKRALKIACINILEQRIRTCSQAISDAQESANSEEKSSAGDKYETGRAMGHLSQEMQSHQLEEARQELTIINSLKDDVLYDKAGFGAAVVTKEIIFFIVLGLGSAEVSGQKTVFLSPNAPLAMALQSRRAGNMLSFNSKTIEILDIF